MKAKIKSDSENAVKRSLLRKIINAMIIASVAFIFLLAAIVGFSQTSTFRNILKDIIVSEANNQINGKLSIGSIQGTLFSSVYINDISLKMDNFEAVSAGQVAVNINILQLLLKNLFFKEILLKDIQVNMLQDSSGIYNLQKLVKPSPEDTTESKLDLPFSIEVAKLSFENINFTKKDYQYLNSEKVYDILNTSDLRINNLTIEASAFIDTDNDFYNLHIPKFAFYPNTTKFALKNFSGNFTVTDNYAEIKDLTVATDSSSIVFNTRMDSINVFNSPDISEIQQSPTKISLQINRFNFDDLSTFIESTSLLKSYIQLDLNAEGKFNDIEIKKLDLELFKSKLALNGKIKNLDTPDDMFIDASIVNSTIQTDDIKKLLPFIDFPFKKNMEFEELNAQFYGNPINFESQISSIYNEGFIEASASLDLRKRDMIYDVYVDARRIDVSPITGSPGIINAKMTVKGSGTDPAAMQNYARLNVFDSYLDLIEIDSLSLNMESAMKIVNLDVLAGINSSKTSLKGTVDFSDKAHPSYNFNGSITDFDISAFLEDSLKQSFINTDIAIKGKNFELDSLIADMYLEIYNSKFFGNQLDYTFLKLETGFDETGRRNINADSDIMNMSLSGNFSLNKAIDVINYQKDAITYVIVNKIKELNPQTVLDTTITGKEVVELPEPGIPKSLLAETFKIDYEAQIKDLLLLSIFMKDHNMNISAGISGEISNEPEQFKASMDVEVGYFLDILPDNIIYISNLKTNFDINRSNLTTKFEDLMGALTFSCDRLFFEQDLYDIHSLVLFNQNKAIFDFETQVDSNIYASVQGSVEMTPIEQEVTISNMQLQFNDAFWSNSDDIRFLISPDFFALRNFNAESGNSKISAKGTFDKEGNQNISISMKNFSGENLLQINPALEKDLADFSLNADALINGTLEKPIITGNVSLNELKVRNSKLGSLTASIFYNEKYLTSDIKFGQDVKDTTSLYMSAGVYFPINLQLLPVKERIIKDKPLKIEVQADNFDLANLGNSLPFINEQKGIFSSELLITGTIDNINYDGFISLAGGKFKALQNNMYYGMEGRLKFDRQEINIEELKIFNDEDLPQEGTMSALGSIKFDGFKISHGDISIEGGLAVLSPETKKVNPFMYGNVYIETPRPLKVMLGDSYTQVRGTLSVRNSDLTIMTELAGFGNEKANIIYKYAVDTTLENSRNLMIERLISQKKKSEAEAVVEEEIKDYVFDTALNIAIPDIARVTFILNSMTNTKLYVETDGNLNFFSKNFTLQGTLQLREGSNLEFFKTFAAQGSITFAGDLTNPILNIVSTYRNTYLDYNKTPPEEKDVAVKLKMNCPMQSLGGELSNPENIAMYIGTKNIENNIHDPSYSLTDAIAFIIRGNLSADEKTTTDSQLENAAKSVLGPLMTGLANSAVGDAINRIDVGQSGEYTQINISGRWKGLKYTVGSPYEKIELNNINMKLEYNYLRFIVRYERKQPFFKSIGLEKQIDELGLKYKFEF